MEVGVREMSKTRNKKSTGTTPRLYEGLTGGQVLLLEAMLSEVHDLFCHWRLCWCLLPLLATLHTEASFSSNNSHCRLITEKKRR